MLRGYGPGPRRSCISPGAGQRMLFGRTSANRPSRFLEEIPPEHLERSGRNFLDRGDSWAASPPAPRATAGYAREERSPYDQRPEPRSAQRRDYGGFSRAMSASAPAAPKGRPDRLPQGGTMVRHKAFGQGMILSIQKMGGDALVEIAFDNVGTKRLMLKSDLRPYDQGVSRQFVRKTGNVSFG